MIIIEFIYELGMVEALIAEIPHHRIYIIYGSFQTL
jgi:hypothetical protein